MKKYFAFSAALLLLAVACTQKEDVQPVDEPQNQVSEAPVVVYIQANGEEDTKASIDGTTGAFKWNTGDRIAVYTSDGYKVSDALASSFNKQASATFSFSGAQAFSEADRANFAVFPASLACDSSNNPYTTDVTASSLKINLPGAYNLSDIKGDLAPVYMIADNAPDGTLEFKNLGALLRFTIINVPKQTLYLTFDFNGKKVQGEFTLTSVTAGTTAVQTAATSSNDDIITVYNDGVFSTFQTNLVVNIPVPAGVAITGEYTDVTITSWDGEPGNGGHKINALVTPLKSSGNWVPARKAARKKEVNLPVFGITVSSGVDAGTKVVFAPGNLQAIIATAPKYNSIVGTASRWQFASKQYEVIGAKMPQEVDPGDSRTTHTINSIQAARTNDVIDLFAWIGDGASAAKDPADNPDYTGYRYSEDETYGVLYPSYSSDTRSDGTKWSQWVGSTTKTTEKLKSDWGSLSIYDDAGAYPPGTWRSLTADERYKVILNRGRHRLRATIKDGDNVVAYGLIIVPDQYTHPAGVPAFINAATNTSSYKDASFAGGSEYTLEQWEKLEGAGCVFFPLTNVRTKGSNSQTIYPGDAWYWNNVCNGSGNASAFAFNDMALNPGGNTSNLQSSGNPYQGIETNKSLAAYCGAAVRLVRVVNDK